jgi:hypothetical protein
MTRFFQDTSGDYALALWFHEAACKKGDVNRFFKDKRLASLHERFSFTNADEWLNQLDQMSYGPENTR